MHINEQYLMYQLAYKLIKEDDFDMLHINPKFNEVWLEKQSRQKSKVIRLIHRGFDWKNHLKRDVASVFQRVTKMGNHFIGKNIEIVNIYVTEHEPVDNWDELKQTLLMKHKKPVKMDIFYLATTNRDDEASRLLNKVDSSIEMEENYPSEMIQERVSEEYKQQLMYILKEKNDAIKRVFNYGKPRFTHALLFINVFIFLILELNGGSMDIETLIHYGAKYNPAIVSGEWWRIISSMFLHIGALHLFMNMLAVYYLGTAVEKIYGSGRFIIIYFLAGIIGSLTSFAFNTHVSAGASGALFGLFGALLYFGVIYKNLFYQTMGKSVIFILIINLAFGFLVPQIDMGAHLGGLIGGFVAAAITSLPEQGTKKRLYKIVGIILFICLTIFLARYGYVLHS